MGSYLIPCTLNKNIIPLWDTSEALSCDSKTWCSLPNTNGWLTDWFRGSVTFSLAYYTGEWLLADCMEVWLLGRQYGGVSPFWSYGWVALCSFHLHIAMDFFQITTGVTPCRIWGIANPCVIHGGVTPYRLYGGVTHCRLLRGVTPYRFLGGVTLCRLLRGVTPCRLLGGATPCRQHYRGTPWRLGGGVPPCKQHREWLLADITG